MKHFLLPVLAVFASIGIQAQSYSLVELEAQFLQKNAYLIAHKYRIAKADAELIQEKLWSNPTLSISELNLWKTYRVEEQPSLIGNYGKNQQLSVELEQIIETAGKRKKRVGLKGLEKNSVVYDYEEVMRELRKELRLAYHQLNYIQQQEQQLNVIVRLFIQLNEQYLRQVSLKNVAEVDFYRLQTELLNLKKEQITLENQRFEVLTQLRLLTHNPRLSLDEILFSSTPQDLVQKLPIHLITLAQSQNIGLKRQTNEVAIAQNQFELATANRVPNLALQMNYDRGGNIMRDFIGFGISFDLPLFDTNKGNIKAAQVVIDEQKSSYEALDYQLIQTITHLQDQLIRLEDSLNQWPKNQLEQQIKLIDKYQVHLQNKQVTLLAFIDFVHAYREANQTYLSIEETYQNTYEELQYIAGEDF